VSSLRLGIFGGTFDPPHLGHLIVAQDVVEILRLDRFLFVPAGEPPHKTDRRVSPAPLRLEMVRALVAGNGAFEVSELEVARNGPSFTVDTLAHYREVHPDAEIFFILGADQAASFDTWHRPEEIPSLATLAVMDRGGSEVSGDRFMPVSVTRVDISATEIRERVRTGRSIRYLVPKNVTEIIERNRLYRAES
jgi:nicotinate-nucleotide adenylyltransferase